MQALPWPIVAALFAPVVFGQTEPTAEETAVLCWINRFRHDPQTFGRLVENGNLTEVFAEGRKIIEPLVGL